MRGHMGAAQRGAGAGAAYACSRLTRLACVIELALAFCQRSFWIDFPLCCSSRLLSTAEAAACASASASASGAGCTARAEPAENGMKMENFRPRPPPPAPAKLALPAASLATQLATSSSPSPSVIAEARVTARSSGPASTTSGA